MTELRLDASAVRNQLRAFICTDLLRHPAYPLEDDEPLMTGGLIDSFRIAQLGVFIELEFGVYIPDVDLTVENMDTLRCMVTQIMRVNHESEAHGGASEVSSDE